MHADAVSRVQPQARRGVLRPLRGGIPAPSSDVTAAALMSRGALSTPTDTGVVEPVRLMLEQGRKWLVVVDERGRPVGLVDRQVLLPAVSGK